MIRLTDPARLGQALGDVRALLGYTRPELARIITTNTGRPLKAVINQLGDWDTGVNVPTASSLGPLLDALGYDLALVPRDEPATDRRTT